MVIPDRAPIVMQTNLTFDSTPRPDGRIAATDPDPTGRTLVRTRLLYAVVAAVLWLLPVAPAALAQQATPVAADVVHGINLADMDLGVRPGDNFYLFANGGWLSRAEIPPDRSSWDSFTELRQQTTNQLLGIMHGMQGPSSCAGCPARPAAAGRGRRATGSSHPC